MAECSDPGTPGEDFRDHVVKIYLENKMSAKEICIMFQKAEAAGISEVGQMAKAGGAGGKWSNAARNLMRTILKGVEYPELYWSEIRV